MSDTFLYHNTEQIGVSDDDSQPLIRQGRRVECRKQGPFEGKRGRVVSVWGGVAQVDFGSSSMTARVENFEPVNA